MSYFEKYCFGATRYVEVYEDKVIKRPYDFYMDEDGPYEVCFEDESAEASFYDEDRSFEGLYVDFEANYREFCLFETYGESYNALLPILKYEDDFLVMPKVDMVAKDYIEYNYDKALRTFSKSRYGSPVYDDFISFWKKINETQRVPLSVLDDFVKQIKELGIEDMHIGNFGFWNDHFVVIDYAGVCE